MSGLIAGIRLSRAGFKCTLIEKKIYPFHRVCGEYISNETLEFLTTENLYPAEFHPAQIHRFQLSTTSGKQATLSLDLGGFGISRYAMDNFLYEIALSAGVACHLNEEVIEVASHKNTFLVKSDKKQYTGDLVIGGMGKRSRIDASLNRSYFTKPSPYAAVKYHIVSDHAHDTIALHNFAGGYCGVSNIENNKTNLCYLVHRDLLRHAGDIKTLEEKVLFKNPLLKKIFTTSEFLFEKPETISEISFVTKEPVWKNIVMTGDAAGMIAPLCGNGMAMAIHSAKLLTDILIENETRSQAYIEKIYSRVWKQHFSSRLRFGRFVQNNLFGNSWSSNLAMRIAVDLPIIARWIIRNTHGKSF